MLVALGWALCLGQLQFSIIITERHGVHPIMFLAAFFVAVLASSLIDEIEKALRCWVLSIGFSLGLVFLLLVIPMYLGVLPTTFVPLIILGSVQPMASTLIINTPIGLLGCFVGQILRNKLL